MLLNENQKLVYISSLKESCKLKSFTDLILYTYTDYGTLVFFIEDKLRCDFYSHDYDISKIELDNPDIISKCHHDLMFLSKNIDFVKDNIELFKEKPKVLFKKKEKDYEVHI